MADVKKKIKARQGHRTFAESVMTKSCELIAGEITEDICRKSDVDKFNYLKSLLHGSAAETINGFSLTKENYCEAIKLLKERYGNKQVVISSQMDSLLKLPEATSMGEVKKLRNIYDKLELHVRSLRNVGVSPDTYGSFLAPVVMSKIPEELRIIITRDLPSGEWKLEPLLKIFNTELQLREKCTLVSGTGQRKEQHFSQRDKGKYINRYQSSTAALLTENKSVQTREGPWCTFCNGNHPSSNCTIVTDISARKQILRRRGKCFKCLKTGHLEIANWENPVITVVIIIIHPYVKPIVSLGPTLHNQLTQIYHNKGILHLYPYVHQQTCLYINPHTTQLAHLVIPIPHMYQMPLPFHLHHNRQMYHPATHLYQPIQQQTCMHLNFHTPQVIQFVPQVPSTHQTQLLHHNLILKPSEHHQPVCLLVRKIMYSYKLLELKCLMWKHLVAHRILE